MKTTRTGVARLLPLLAILAVLPLATAGCEDAGDEPDGPTGPTSQYNPVIDASGASISVKIKDESSPGNEYPGEDFAIIAVLKDGNGKPIQGVPLTVQAETGTGSVTEYFSFDINPSVTNSSGLASFGVAVSDDCPMGSYRFAVKSSPGTQPVSGPTAVGFAGIKIVSVPDTGVPSITSVNINGATSAVVGGAYDYEVRVTYSSGCTPEVQISFGAPYANLPAPYFISHTWSAPGQPAVRAQARCSGATPGPWVESEPLRVSVSEPVTP